MRTTVGNERNMLVLAAQLCGALSDFLRRHWPVGVSDAVLGAHICRADTMFYGRIIFYFNKTRRCRNTVKNKAKAVNGPARYGATI